MLLTCRIYLNHDSVLVTILHVNFWFGHYSGGGWVSYITLGLVEKCYIVLHRVGGWSKNAIFALYNM